jgi:hypothetical protein
MKGQLMRSIGRFPIFAACLAAVSIFYFVSQRSYSAEQTVSAQWSLQSSGRAPLVDMIDTHAYQPSAWLVSPAQWKIWFCGGDSAHTMGDSIFYTVANPLTNHAEKPIRVLAPGNSDTAEDGLHACAPSVIKRTWNAADGGYLLYYECARRIYDRARNYSNDAGFTQICGATSDDGTAWRRLNNGAPLITAAPRVLENCRYAFINGRHTIDTGRPACSLANQINNYGAGHPSAIVVADGNSKAVWLYYYDSKGDWLQHGVYLAKSEDGINFGNAVKTNLPNDAHVKYFAGRFGGWNHVFVAATVIGKTNGILVSEDGVDWLPADGSVIDASVVSNEHCAAPGTGELVGDDANNLVSLSVAFLSSEGYRGTADQGEKSGCYAASEDRVRGGSWKTYVMQGEIRPVVRSR